MFCFIPLTCIISFNPIISILPVLDIDIDSLSYLPKATELIESAFKAGHSELVKDRGSWCAVVHDVTKSQI